MTSPFIRRNFRTVPKSVELTLVSSTSTSITVEWTTPDEVYDYFFVQVNSSGIQLQQNITFTNELILSGLQPGSRYDMYITVYSGLTIDVQASETTVNTFYTNLDAPTQLTVVSFGETWLMLTWSLSGDVSYQCLLNTTRVSLNYTTNSTTINITDLAPGQSYTIYLSSYVDIGIGERLFSKTVNTSAMLYPTPPVNLVVYNISRTTITVHWNNPPPPAVTTGYTITWYNQPANTTFISHVTQLQDTLTGLTSGQTYYINVYSNSGVVQSRTSIKVKATTVACSMLDLSVSSHGSSYLYVTWSVCNSTFDLYQAKIQPSDTTVNISSSSFPMYNFTNLIPGVTYTISIQTIASTTASGWTNTSATTTPLPVQNLKAISSKKSTTLIITWTPATASFQNIYHITVAGIYNGFVNTTDVTVEGIQPGGAYSCTVTPYSNSSPGIPSSVEYKLNPEFTAIISETSSNISTLMLTFTDTPSGLFDQYVFSLNGQIIERSRSSTDKTIMFTNLNPGTPYMLEAWVVSNGLTSDKIQRVLITNPLPPTVQCSSMENQITLVLTRPSGGVTYYVVNCTFCNVYRGIAVSGSRILNTTLEGLIPNHSYLIQIHSLVQNKYSLVIDKTCSTAVTVPSPVQNLTITNVLPFQLTLSWNDPESASSPITEFCIKLLLNTSIDVQKIVTLSNMNYSYVLDNLLAGDSYIIMVFASNSVGQSAIVTKTITMPIYSPVIDRQDLAVPQSVSTGSTQSIIQLNYVYDERYGPINVYSVIVSKQNSPPPAQLRQGDQRFAYTAIQCNGMFNADPSAQCWREDSLRVKQQGELPSVSVVIGAETSCNSAIACNSPLEPSTDYYILLRAYSSVNYTDTPYLKIHTNTSPPSANSSLPLWAIIVIIVLSAVLLLIIVSLICLICWRQRRNRKSTNNLRTPVVQMATKTRQSHTKSRSVKIAEFSAHVSRLSKDSEFLFSEEFEDLKDVGRDQSVEAAELAVNRIKNRFTNILPYEHSRVKLLATDVDDGSDYINANWMPGFNSKREYICAQGPLASTVDDFWRMLWEHRCKFIVMLTKCLEKNREKCHQYWPTDGDAVVYGDVQVELLNTITNTDWIISTFRVSKGEDERLVNHYHFLAWPDFGVPDHPGSLISFVRMYRNKIGTDNSATIIHCSAGVGRSGAFIAIDIILQQLASGVGYIDIYGLIYQMRLFRSHMVQLEQQYICIHKCIQFVLEGKETTYNPIIDKGNTNQSFYDDEGIVLRG